jgi:hypothetical protein
MLLNRIRTRKFAENNPSAQVTTDIASRHLTEPKVSITFRTHTSPPYSSHIIGDSQTLTYHTSRMTVDDLLQRISKYCARLEDRA